MLRFTGIVHFAICLLLFISCTVKQQRYTNALSPEQEMSHFELDSDFTIELFAHEPHVLSPVDMAWDDEGNIYVIEMGDYPWKADSLKPKGRIRVLKDNNADSKIDTSVVFADMLPSATSILPWNGGIIVAAAPDILFLKDTTGDLRADYKEVLFTGFFANNSEAHITSFRFGIDNWIYANNNGQEGKIIYKKDTSKPALDVGNSDFRFRIDKGLFENESGTGQFGLTMDEWGHRFYTQNTLHLQEAPIQWRYLHRHNYLPPYESEVNISDHDFEMFQKTPPPYWRKERTKRRQEEFDKEKLDRKEYAEKHFTGCSGSTYYLSDAFPGDFYGSIFTGEVAGNLIHRDIVVPGKNSPVFVAKRSDKEKDREFLTSTDPWTRPANFIVGPDGYLYMIDMYRQHIEAPTSIPDDLKADMDYSEGEQYGRIYRIKPKNAATQKVALNVATKNSAELVSLLADPNQWLRTRAHILLIQRKDKSVVPLLKTMFETNTDARARIHSMYVLEDMGELNASMVSKAMKDPEPGIREHAAILSEKYPQLLPQLLELVNDSSSRVVLQSALSIGQFNDKRATLALAKIAEEHANDKLFRTAVLSSNQGSGVEFLKNLSDRNIFFKDTSEGKRKFIHDLSHVVGARNIKEEMIKLTTILSYPGIKNDAGMQLACVEGLADGLNNAENKGMDPSILTALEKNLPTQNEEIKAAITKIRQASETKR